LSAEHRSLRESFRQAESRSMSAESLLAFAQQLSAHIRKEERRLFERIQQLMNADELEALGVRLESALRNAGTSCAMPNKTTKLRPQS
jgi:hemerythrin-like domain-containing protein